MTVKEAMRLLPGTVVRDGADNLGTVRKFNSTGFYVDWEHGKRGWISYRDAGDISIR